MKDIFKLFSLKFVSAFLGVLSSIITVRLFGASRGIEVYFAAQSLVYLVTSLTQSGQLAEVFLPEYHILMAKSDKLGFMGLNVVLNRFFIWGVVIIGVVFIAAPLLIKVIVPGFSDLEQQEAVLIFRVLLPCLLLQLFISFFITVLNAEKKFGRAELLGLSNLVLNIVLLLSLYQYLGVWAVVISVIVGKAVEFIFYLSQLYKLGFRYTITFSLEGFDHASFFKTMGSTLFYVGATQIYSVVLTAGISFLPEGTFAIFKYVQGLSGKIKGLLIQPFMTVFFTSYSKLLQSALNVEKEFNKYFTSILAVNTVMILGGVLLGDVFIDLLWGGTKFTPDNVALAYLFLLFNLFSIAPSGIGSIYRKMAVAHGKAKVLYRLWVFSQLICAVLTYGLLKYFKIYGLFLIMPINTLLMGLVSVLVYFRTENSISYKIFTGRNLILVLLVCLAFGVKYTLDLPLSDLWVTIPVLLLFTLVFSVYPLINTYKAFRQ